MPTQPPTAIPPFVGVLPEAQRIAGLAWPVTLGQVALVGMGTVDVIVVGQLGAEALAGFALANVLSFSVLAPGLGAAMGLDPFFTRAHGSGDRRATGTTLVRGAVLLALLAVPMTAVHLLAGPLLSIAGQDPAILPIAESCSLAMALRVVPFLGFSLIRQLLQAAGSMRPAMVVAVMANLVNLVADVWLVGGGLGVPAFGAVGAAWSTTVVQAFMFAVLWALAAAPMREALAAADRPTVAGVVAVARTSLPVAAQLTVEIWAFNAASLLAGAIGAVALAAHTAALNIASLAFMFPLGVGAAGATRVGNLVGAGRPWRQSGWTTVGVGLSCMAVSASVFLLIPGPLARVYTSDPGVVALTVAVLPIAAAFQIVDGTQVTAAGVLRGVGDTRVPFLINLVAHWALGLPVGAALAFGAGLGLPGLWLGLSVGLSATAVLLMARIHTVRPERSLEG
ncbi:MAG: MATE family multidrug resistance protein [Myxococcota bacterium]|jgi:MATE family multidrug resistance protein